MAWQEELAAATATRTAPNEERRRLLIATQNTAAPVEPAGTIEDLWITFFNQIAQAPLRGTLGERLARFVQGTGYPAEYAWLRLGTAPLAIVDGYADGQVAVPYSSSSIATGGKAPYTFAITSGVPPSGTVFTPATSLIAGTPDTATTYPITLQVTDSLGRSTSLAVSITIIP